jgi:hypothetical protein
MTASGRSLSFDDLDEPLVALNFCQGEVKGVVKGSFL